MPQVSAQSDPYAHLYGTIDPSDGIPYRRAEPTEKTAERGGAGPWPPFERRYICRRGNLWRVRVKLGGQLIHVGYFASIAKARQERDKFLLAQGVLPERNPSLLGFLLACRKR